MRLVLASASPRRAALLEQLGLDFDQLSPGVDETRQPDELPGQYVERVARAKAIGVDMSDALILAADTCVVLEGRIMGKPAHPSEAKSMLQRLQGTTHEVFTGLAAARGGEINSLVDVTEVRMMAMTDTEISDYIATGEPMDKAGAYAIQGMGGIFVESVAGSPYTVIGLPIHLLPRLTGSLGFGLDRFKRGLSV